MKNITFLILLFIGSYSFADAGYTYRFYLNMQSNNGESTSGYFYLNTYKKYNDDSNISFKKYYEGKDEITLYSHISTVNTGSHILDFTHKDYKIKISLKDFSQIRIQEFVDFGNTDRLFEITSNELNLVRGGKPKSAYIYNEKYSENCGITLIAWNDNAELLKHQTEISEKIKKYLNINEKFNDYMIHKKESLLKDGILFIFHCEAL